MSHRDSLILAGLVGSGRFATCPCPVPALAPALFYPVFLFFFSPSLPCPFPLSCARPTLPLKTSCPAHTPASILVYLQPLLLLSPPPRSLYLPACSYHALFSLLPCSRPHPLLLPLPQPLPLACLQLATVEGLPPEALHASQNSQITPLAK